MATDTDRPGRTGDSSEIVLEGMSAGDRSIDAHQSIEADGITMVDVATEDEQGPRVEVLVVPDAHVKATHPDAPQVFASAARLRPVFAALSAVLVVCVLLAVFGMTVLVAV